MRICYLCGNSTGGCNGNCNSPTPQPNEPVWRSNQPPKGCICPPTSEKTCQRWDCGRKSVAAINGPYASPTTPNPNRSE